MKDKILWIVIALVTLVTLGVILMFNAKPKEIESFKSMHLGYSNGWSIYANINYEVLNKDDGYYVTIKPYGVPDDEKQTVKLTDEQVKELLEILNKYEVRKWNGFHKTDRNVLDGDSFSFSLYTEDDEISASGYMRWPKNYSEVRSALYDLFNPLYQYKDDKVYE